ncbi:MAG TPA: rod shape-determining protein MreD [Tissierellaceae bacterium]|nr:rod shape-determining protein MreD [Tissierellaceae bacterium]
MNIIILALTIILNIIIESTIIPYIPILGYVPNLALIIITVVALLKGKYYGAFFGLILGLLEDILFGKVVGVNALLYFLLGYTNGLVSNALNMDNLAIPVIATSFSTISYNLFYALMIFFLSMNINSSTVLKNVFSLEILYNGLLSIFLYKMFSGFLGNPSLRFRRRQR